MAGRDAMRQWRRLQGLAGERLLEIVCRKYHTRSSMTGLDGSVRKMVQEIVRHKVLVRTAGCACCCGVVVFTLPSSRLRLLLLSSNFQ
jgi:hypothetical protein